jgi:hypothetical protein
MSLRLPRSTASSGALTALVGAMVCALMWGGCGGQQQPRPQVRIERVGEPLPPLPEKTKVKVFLDGEPDSSYREVGRITATCPVEHWVGGRQEKGRPVCLDGLRQGARKLGAQAVVEVRAETVRPSWAPETPWLIMHGVAVRLFP